MVDETKYDWKQEEMLEIDIFDSDSFLKIRETLTRIGMSSEKDGHKILYPSCNILHKQGRYFIVHFKELFALDGKPNSLTLDDIARRNGIAALLEEWNLCKILNPERYRDQDISRVRIVKFSEKSKWDIQPKYNIGTVKN